MEVAFEPAGGEGVSQKDVWGRTFQTKGTVVGVFKDQQEGWWAGAE